MLWGISPNAPAKEQIKSEFEGIIRGLNCVGEIDYLTYSKLFDEIMPLFDKMHEQGMKDTVIWHKWPDEKPKRGNAYLCTLLIKGKYLGLQIWPYEEDNMPPWHMIESDEKKIIAWAELPRPYQPT